MYTVHEIMYKIAWYLSMYTVREIMYRMAWLEDPRTVQGEGLPGYNFDLKKIKNIKSIELGSDSW